MAGSPGEGRQQGGEGGEEREDQVVREVDGRSEGDGESQRDKERVRSNQELN